MATAITHCLPDISHNERFPIQFKRTAMATYLELMEKAQKLMAEAEQVRRKEVSDVIADIRRKMEAYGLTLQDIGGAPAGRRRGPAPKGSKGPKSKTVKYRGPNGETWGGGRGRKPRWVQEALKAGKKIEDFAV
jgi:DNA-binding protein H-NS